MVKGALGILAIFAVVGALMLCIPLVVGCAPFVRVAVLAPPSASATADPGAAEAPVPDADAWPPPAETDTQPAGHPGCREDRDWNVHCAVRM